MAANKADLMVELVDSYSKFRKTFEAFVEAFKQFAETDQLYHVLLDESSEVEVVLKVMNKRLRGQFEIVRLEQGFSGVLRFDKALDADKWSSIRRFYFDVFGNIHETPQDEFARYNLTKYDGVEHVCVELIDALIEKYRGADDDSAK